jgi:hypothetical protein
MEEKEEREVLFHSVSAKLASWQSKETQDY